METPKETTNAPRFTKSYFSVILGKYRQWHIAFGYDKHWHIMYDMSFSYDQKDKAEEWAKMLNIGLESAGEILKEDGTDA